MDKCCFQWDVLNSFRLPTGNVENAVFTYSGLGNILRANTDALIIVSGFSFAAVKVYLRSLRYKTPYLVWSGAINNNNRLRTMLQHLYRVLLVSKARGCIAYGKLAKNYLISLGADPSSVSVGINTVDTSLFRFDRERRKRYSDCNRREFIYIGDLSVRKRVDLLLIAVAQLARHRSDFLVRLVGTGPEYDSLNQLSRRFCLENIVKFEGFRQQEDVACLLACSHYFVFPTGYDIWGLVLIEAMAAGLTCLSSIHAGATHDLIIDGVNGFTVNFEDTAGVVRLMNWVLDHPAECDQIGENASRLINNQVTISLSAKGFIDAIDNALCCSSA